jgi:hypothetical protein
VIAMVDAETSGRDCFAELEARLDGAGWIAARCMPTGGSGFAHTASVRLGPSAGAAEAAAQLRPLIDATGEWADTAGQYANPRRKQALLDRCAEARAKLGGAP